MAAAVQATAVESIPALTAEQIDRLAQVQSRIEANDDVQVFLDLDREFHLTSYAGCDSGPLIESVTRLWNSTQYYRRAFMLVTGPQRRWVVNAEHALLLDAIRRGDLVDAERFSWGHIRRTGSNCSSTRSCSRRADPPPYCVCFECCRYFE